MYIRLHDLDGALSYLLQVYDGPNDTSSMIGAHCGNILPPSALSSSNNVFIKFVSDESNTGSGFTISYVINSKTSKFVALIEYTN